MNKEKLVLLFKRIPHKIKVFGTVLICILIVLAVLLCTFSPLTTNEAPKEETSPSTSENDPIKNQKPVKEETPYSAEDGKDDEDPENGSDTAPEGAVVESKSLQSTNQRTLGIDVSKWQGKIDWSRVKNEGIEFAFIRVGYRGENGRLYRDDNAAYNLTEADKAGVKLGAYFYSTAINEAEIRQEVQLTLDMIAAFPISYPVVFDCEGFTASSARTFPLTVSERTRLAKLYFELIEDAGYETMLYSGANELSGGLWDLDTLGKDTLIWVAQYPETPYPKQEFPDYDGKVDAWQFTDRGKIGGIESNVDLVVCYFTRDEKSAKDPDKKPEIKVPKSQDELEYTPCNEAVTAKIEVNLREGPTTSSEIVATLRNPDTLTRVGVGKNGWSRLEFGDTYVYAISSYLTTDLTPPKEEPDEDIVGGMLFTPTDDSVTAKIEVNLRESPTTDSAIVGVLKSGTFLPRTAISTHGWSRLTFEGRAVYAVSSYLSTTVVEAPPPDDGFSAVDEQVTAKSETNLRTAPSTTSSEVVYTLMHGEFVRRVGIHSNGWSKLEYDGKTVYAVTSYLTTEVQTQE